MQRYQLNINTTFVVLWLSLGLYNDFNFKFGILCLFITRLIILFLYPNTSMSHTASLIIGIEFKKGSAAEISVFNRTEIVICCVFQLNSIISCIDFLRNEVKWLCVISANQNQATEAYTERQNLINRISANSIPHIVSPSTPTRFL